MEEHYLAVCLTALKSVNEPKYDNLDSVLSCVLCKILHCSQMAQFGLVNNGTSLCLNSYDPKQGASWCALSSVVTGHELAA